MLFVLVIPILFFYSNPHLFMTYPFVNQQYCVSGATFDTKIIEYSTNIDETVYNGWGAVPGTSTALLVKDVPDGTSYQSIQMIITNSAGQTYTGTPYHVACSDVVNSASITHGWNIFMIPDPYEPRNYFGNADGTYSVRYVIKSGITPPVCVPNWVCGQWGTCNAGTQIRQCSDGCGQSRSESQACPDTTPGNGGSNQCPVYEDPKCNILEHKAGVGSDLNGCPLPTECRLNPDIIGPVIFAIILMVGIFVAYLIRKKR